MQEEISKVPYYTDWGWIDPKGIVIDGLRMKGVKLHSDITDRKGFKTPEAAIRVGWVRWYLEKSKGGNRILTFTASLDEKTVRLIDRFLATVHIHANEYMFVDLIGTSGTVDSDDSQDFMDNLRRRMYGGRRPMAAQYTPVGVSLYEEIRRAVFVALKQDILDC